MPRKAQIESVAAADGAPGGAAAVDRALSLLAAFRTGDISLSLAELAARTRLYKSTALRLLASLEHARLLQRLENGTYSLGSEVARLSTLYAASFSLERVVLPVLRRTGREDRRERGLSRPPGPGLASVLYRVDSPHPIRDHIKAGDLLPLDRGTGGRVLTAFDPSRARSGSAADRKLLAGVRERGFHAATGDRLAEVAGISAPVWHADGTLAAAVTLTMPSHRYHERYVKPVLEAARRLSGQV